MSVCMHVIINWLQDVGDRRRLGGQEMGENLDVVREVWGMHLAATRNRIIRINLLVTVGAFALTACIVPASFFGMNLQHGLEARASHFTCSLPSSRALLFIILYGLKARV